MSLAPLLRPATPRPGSLAALFVGVVLLTTIDLLADAGEGAGWLHTLLEAGLLATGLTGLLLMRASLSRSSARAKALEAHATQLSTSLAETRADAARWQADAQVFVRGLGDAIDQQLCRWALTDAEKEVALLLLKGFSHKEIAALRGTGPATTRQQARSLYKKAGLTGRHDLSAFFLEDLLSPQPRLSPAPERHPQSSR